MSEHAHAMINEDVDTIIKLAQEYDLDALTIVDGEFELSIVRREPQAVAPALAPTPAAAIAPAPTPAAPLPTLATAEPAMPQGNVVAAPIIGVFYHAASPDAAPFVALGDRVSVGQTLCILEAMKLMNEITSDYSGYVTGIHVENAELVTIGQPLFTVSASPNA